MTSLYLYIWKFNDFKCINIEIVGGNQREIDRKRSEERKNKGPKKALGDANARKEKDTNIMLQKQKAHDEKKAAEAEAARLAKLEANKK
ncbi:hypothetical protein DLAC_00211 [Tieghemostelium lacteum]|uniref:Small EDRK-rich factor-like N-terminal domain-containing protein n=1 Tax=Tieghemostelium lacteum TaxID=361077 RepID=A0A152A948_TIELA|nr:hypothetical protein DLAC_00211 [Tieghemostelium lacteum]|eukprot:KYR02748.1 hypothetical protein DLAC_00211 [Tieghemostelium lacteum]